VRNDSSKLLKYKTKTKIRRVYDEVLVSL